MSTQSAGAEASATVTLDVSLLGRDYKVACKESERAELGDAVALLDRRMREIREGGKIAGAERIAVMAALNLAHDLLRERRQTRPTAPSAQASSTRAPPPLTTRRCGVESNAMHVGARCGPRRARATDRVHVPCGVRAVHTLFEPMLLARLPRR